MNRFSFHFSFPQNFDLLITFYIRLSLQDMERVLQQRLKAIQSDLHDYMTAQNKMTLVKLQHYLKNNKNVPHFEHLTEEGYYQSPEEQVEALERKIKNNLKGKLSDFQAFLHFTKKEDLNQEFLQLIQMLKITQRSQKHSKEQPLQIKAEDLKILNLSVHQLSKFACSFLEEKGKCRELIKHQQLWKLVRLVSQQYIVTSYHNFSHSVSVMVLFRQIEEKLNLSEHYGELQLFIAEIAALAHDLGHKGLNASWEVKTKSQLASIYHSDSVLEKMHISKFFRLLKEHKDVDFFQAIKDVRQRDSAKKQFIRLILGTDMSKHFKSLQKMQNRSHQNKQNLSPSHKDEALQLIFHAADIGNPCMQFEDYMNWSILLTFEFNAQALKEEKAQVSISPGFKYSGLQNFYSGQVGFIKTFCMPLWNTIAGLYPAAQFYQARVQENWTQVENRLEEIRKKANL